MLAKSSPNHLTRSHYIVLVAVVLAVSSLTYWLTANVVPPHQRTEAADSADMGGVAVVSPPHLLPDFTLTSHTGQPVSLSDFRGRNVLLFFGYTHCPDVCPTTLADYVRVKQALGTQAEDTAFVFISVDGQRDTPEVMAKYLAQFDTDFIGLTGGEDTMRQIGTDYGLNFAADHVNVGHTHDDHEGEHSHDDENYFVEHTSPSFLVDPDGYLRLVYFYGTKPETIATGIQHMLTEQES